MVLKGSYEHVVFRRVDEPDADSGAVFDRWRRSPEEEGAYGASPTEPAVRLDVQLAQRRCVNTGGYFLNSTAIHGIDGVSEEGVMTLILRSKLRVSGFTLDTYSHGRPVWSKQKEWCSKDEVGQEISRWVARMATVKQKDEELIDCKGTPVDVGGCSRLEKARADAAIAPGTTLNEIAVRMEQGLDARI